MEIVSSIASVTQLVAYAHSTTKVLVQLYKLVRGGPLVLQNHASSVKTLLSVIQSLQQNPAPDHVIAVLVEIAALAQDASNLIVNSQTRGVFGTLWAAIYDPADLVGVFASLQEKRDILHLAVTADIQAMASSVIDQCRSKSKSKSTRTKLLKRMFRMSSSKIEFYNGGGDCINSVANGHKGRDMPFVKYDNRGRRSYNDVGNSEKLAPGHIKAFMDVVGRSRNSIPMDTQSFTSNEENQEMPIHTRFKKRFSSRKKTNPAHVIGAVSREALMIEPTSAENDTQADRRPGNTATKHTQYD